MKITTRILIAVTALTALCAAPGWAQTREAVAAPTPQEGRPSTSLNTGTQAVHKGITWMLRSTNSPTGTVVVGCNGCDAYNGDTSCATALPILCIKKSGPGFPLQRPTSVDDSNQYYRWSGGVIGTTSPTVPPATLTAANALCVKEFGADWRAAEHHDGWGWDFQAFGGVGNPAQRFWININDQPGATCWHQ
jgi:hypothetical protein